MVSLISITSLLLQVKTGLTSVSLSKHYQPVSVSFFITAPLSLLSPGSISSQLSASHKNYLVT